MHTKNEHRRRQFVTLWLAALTMFLSTTACQGETNMHGTVRAPDFPKGSAWLNTSEPLTFQGNLKGQVVLLDFWTYCCINCMHVIPDLAYLEEKFKDEPFVVIGVHSAKFENESDPANIRAAIQRYQVHHPVVVDQRMRIWDEYGVNSWPTLVLIGPDGRVIGSVSGEGHRQQLEKIITQVLEEGRRQGTLAKEKLKIETDGLVRSAGGLSFPGDIAVDAKNGRLVIVDSNHNRLLMTTLPDSAGHVELIAKIGGGQQGHDDGDFASAQFNRPQGVSISPGGDILYVADTENHLIRRIDVTRKMVTTILGTGQQEWDREGGKSGRKQGLNSPWDVAVNKNTLYISMAGNHQIWQMNLLSGMAEPLVGSGRENIRDGDAESANLAQPSGIVLDAAKNRLYFADSEVSSVRYVDLNDRSVHTIIGHGLFDFGDVDGDAESARFQHCLGVTLGYDGTLLVADTYNHRIKQVDPDKRTSTGFYGNGKRGELFEPSNLTTINGSVLVADTNNHRILMIDEGTKSARELMISGLETHVESQRAEPGVAARMVPAITLAQDKTVTLSLAPEIPVGCHLTPGAPVSLRIEINGKPAYQQTINSKNLTVPITLPISADKLPPAGEWVIRLAYSYCSEGFSAVCRPAEAAWATTVSRGADGQVLWDIK